MEPISESRRAVDDFGPFTDDGDLLDQLGTAADEVTTLVPSAVGVTLAYVREDIAFTLVASDAEVAELDAVQYLDDGPCVASARRGAPVVFEAADATDEGLWTWFARATAARGVASTLTLPVIDPDGQVTGSVNLYAGAPHAFDGRHEQVADIFGAWAGGAVTDADLDFTTLETARRTPQVLDAGFRVSRAVGRLMVDLSLDADAAEARLRQAALRAGVDLAAIADLVLDCSITEI